MVNKQDGVSDAERAKVLAHLGKRLAAIFGRLPSELYSFSARQALEAQLKGDKATLKASGLPAFETALLDFLLNEKRREFLLSMCSRIGKVLEAAADTETEERRLAALGEEIAAMHSERMMVETAASIPSVLPECEICMRVADAVFTFLASYQYRLNGDQKARTDLEERRGLCGPHTWAVRGYDGAA